MRQAWFSFDVRRGRTSGPSRAERGTILPLTLMILLILASLVSALLALGVTEPQIAANLLRGSQALFAAEAGVERAFAQMLATQDPNDFTINFTNFITAGFPAGTMFTDVAIGGSTYTVTALDNNDGDGNLAADADSAVFLSSTGTAPGGATRTIRTLVTSRYDFKDAVVTNGDLSLSGSGCVQGSRGGVHSNSNLTVSGGSGMEIDQHATATVNYTESGSPQIGGQTGGNQPRHPIPSLQPSNFRSLASIVLKSTGTATDGAGNPISIPSGWSFTAAKGANPASWTFNGSTGTDGTYFVETAVSITSSPNTPTNPWRASLISTAHIEISGSPNMAPATDPATWKPRGLQLLAGGDIDISGTPSGLAGLIYAREQIDFHGTPSIAVGVNGAIIALDAADSAGSPVRANRNKIGGNTCITLEDGNIRFPINGPLRFLSWSTVTQ